MHLFFPIYGLFLLIGGFIGFKKSGSKASLIAGISSSLFIALGWWIMPQEPQVGIWIYSGVSLALTIVFACRTFKTKKMMPSGMLLLLSIIGFVLTLREIIS